MKIPFIHNKNSIINSIIFIILGLLLLNYNLISISIVIAVLIFFIIQMREENLYQVLNIHLLGTCIAGGLGFTFALSILGTKILNPSYIDWLLTRGDPSQHFLGWHFFRNETWHIPIGVIESLNTPTGTTITYMDSIPLFGLFFKTLNFILPDVFQYLGWWIFFCYILQGIFGYLLMTRITNRLSLQILGSMFFISSPIMLWRAYGHEALMGHWIILASLYLLFNDRINQRFWLVLLTISLLVHPYLFFMIYLFYAIKLIFLLLYKSISLSKGSIYFLSSVSVVGVVLWAIGYFYIGGGGSIGGFGYYSMNITSIINPQGWSNGFIQDRPSATNGQYEGFNYLGIGVLFLMVISLGVLVQKELQLKEWKKFIPVILGCFICVVFALSNVVTFDKHTLFSVSLPEFIMKLFGMVRVSGRFFWPVYYCSIYFILFIIIKKTRTNYVAVLLIIALVLQFIDLSSKYKEFNELYTKEMKWETSLKSELWTEISKEYKHVVFIPAESKHDNDNSYLSFAMFAALNHMSINIAYVARDNNEKRELYKKDLLSDFKNKKWDEQTIYIVNESLSNVVLSNITNNSKDLFIKLDGFNVLLPDGYSKIIKSNENYISENRVSYAIYNFGDTIKFGENDNFQKFIGTGWGTIDKDGAWIEDDSGELFLKVKKPQGNLKMTLFNLRYLSTEQHNLQRVSVYVNNHLLQEMEVNKQNFDYSITIPKELILDEIINIKFALHDVKTPKDLGINEDTRRLGLWLKSITISDE